MRLLLLGLVVWGLSGCSQTCTLIGCGDRIEVVFDGTVPDGTTVVLVTPDGTRHEATQVGPQVFWVGGEAGELHPERATVEVSRAGETSQVEIAPDYQARRPNGMSCPPLCWRATVEIPLASLEP